jgi:hypothetical protein
LLPHRKRLPLYLIDNVNGGKFFSPFTGTAKWTTFQDYLLKNYGETVDVALLGKVRKINKGHQTSSDD